MQDPVLAALMPPTIVQLAGKDSFWAAAATQRGPQVTAGGKMHGSNKDSDAVDERNCISTAPSTAVSALP
jgi:hypothetical protein